jgi:ferredoxin-NADP reductase
MELTARIARIRQETPTVKSFLFDLDQEEFTFFPGQWIDLYIERLGEEPLIGGYTMVSSPTQRGVMELAIKREGGGQAAIYMHERARVGDSFFISGPGGQFYFKDGMAESLVLIAGGIGINPLMCIVRYIAAKGLAIPTILFYSARTSSDLLFHQDLRALEAESAWLRCRYTVTRPDQEPWAGRTGRINAEMLREAPPREKTLYYICGPRGMPSEIDSLLKAMGVQAGTVQMEEW